jgi:hypothetical protein
MLTEDELVLPTIGQTLGAKDGIAEHIDEKRLLLLLDNLEQLLRAAPAVAELLTTCRNLRLLVTSRATLRVAAERVRGGAAAGGRRRIDVHATCPRGAPRFRARRVRRRDLPPPRLLGRPERRLPLLTGGARDAPARQQTLRATIEWSHDLLPPDQRRLFAGLAVFGGSFTAEAVEAVCRCDLDALSLLVEQSLVRRWASGRLGMLETIREYALERFEELEERDELRQRQLEDVLELAGRTRDELRQEAWLRRMEAERDNIRGALAWSLSAGDPVEGLRLAAALGDFWVIRDHVEGFRWLSEALERAEGAPLALRADGLRWAGSTVFFTHDFARAEKFGQESLALFRQLGDKGEIAATLDRLAAAQLALEQLDEGRASTEESLALYEEVGDRRGAVYPLEARLARMGGRKPRPWYRAHGGKPGASARVRRAVVGGGPAVRARRDDARAIGSRAGGSPLPGRSRDRDRDR